jgi:hypothetical protein
MDDRELLANILNLYGPPLPIDPTKDSTKGYFRPDGYYVPPSTTDTACQVPARLLRPLPAVHIPAINWQAAWDMLRLFRLFALTTVIIVVLGYLASYLTS